MLNDHEMFKRGIDKMNNKTTKGLCCVLVIVAVAMFLSTVSYVESCSNDIQPQTAITAYNA